MEDIKKELVEIKEILLRLLEMKSLEHKMNYGCFNSEKGCTKSKN